MSWLPSTAKKKRKESALFPNSLNTESCTLFSLEFSLFFFVLMEITDFDLYRLSQTKIFNCIYSTSHSVLTEITTSWCNDLGNVSHTCQPTALHREALMKPGFVVMIEIPPSSPLYVGVLTIKVDSFLYYLLMQIPKWLSRDRGHLFIKTVYNIQSHHESVLNTVILFFTLNIVS